MSSMPDMTPTSLVCYKVRIYTDEKLAFLKRAWHLKG